ncbi:MAG: 50S ribosomal protein L13 [Elusimicrobia bacterium]|nr:MAG: 50S ribosomal protein L13 [Elusimicrobiota bacterium]
MSQKTTQIDSKYAQQHRRWILIDAKDAVLGRLATKAANLLRGKGKRFFTPSIDCGDFVIVTNAKNIKVTGDKENQKFYFRHSGYPKGAKVIPFKQQMEKDSRKVISMAVKRMLPETLLRQHQMRRLKVYPGADHPHTAQKVEAPSD